MAVPAAAAAATVQDPLEYCTLYTDDRRGEADGRPRECVVPAAAAAAATVEDPLEYCTLYTDDRRGEAEGRPREWCCASSSSSSSYCRGSSRVLYTVYTMIRG
eukprot:COSAG02_NODE_1475_length_12422_cov_20.622170_7_plen_103_part_00